LFFSLNKVEEDMLVTIDFISCGDIPTGLVYLVPFFLLQMANTTARLIFLIVIPKRALAEFCSFAPALGFVHTNFLVWS
jgi:hypothetical protein